MTQHITIPIAGMRDLECVERVRAVLERVPGVRSARVKPGAASITYDPARTGPLSFVRAIADSGFAAVAANSSAYAGAGRRTCCNGDPE